MTAATPPIATGFSSTRTSIGSTVALARASPSSSMTWTCSGSMRGFCGGSKYSRASAASPPKAVTMSRASASPSPPVSVRSFMALPPIASEPESNGWGRRGSGPLLDLLALLFGSLGLACLLRLPFYGPRQPAAPLGVAPLVEDAAAQRRVGGEARRLGPEEVVCPLPLHPVPYLLVPGELLLVATPLIRKEPRRLRPVRQPHRGRLPGQIALGGLPARGLGRPTFERLQPSLRDLEDLLVRPLPLLDDAVGHEAALLQPRELGVDLAVPGPPTEPDPPPPPLRQALPPHSPP